MANATTGSDSLQNLKIKTRASESDMEKVTHTAGEMIGSMASDLADSATTYVRASGDFVKDNPARGIAIAAAAGLVAGSILTLAMRRRH